jgi:hypothetical protein
LSKVGLYPEQVTQWRQACEQANDWDRSHNKRLQAARSVDHKQIKQLERDLTQKEKALAEIAAWLVLRKKSRRSGEKPRAHDQCPRSPGYC